MTKAFQPPWVPIFLDANTVASRSRFRQLARESLLFKVTVGGQRFLNVLPFHEQKNHRVAKRIALVQALTEEVKRLLMKPTIHPDNLDAAPRIRELSYVAEKLPVLFFQPPEIQIAEYVAEENKAAEGIGFKHLQRGLSTADLRAQVQV